MGKIYLTKDPSSILEDLSFPILKIFQADEFKIANAKEVIREAYILESEEKCIAIVGKIFNLEAQNALLKILEEPPRGVEFLILTPNKNSLLPTIRSRMQIINAMIKTPLLPLELNPKELTLEKIYSFLKNLDSLPRIQSQEIIQRLLKNIQASNIQLPQKELDFFNTAIRANLCYERLQIVLLPILLHLVSQK